MIAANLPYNVATPLLIGWLESEPWPPWFERMVLMFQREVAERIVAAPGTQGLRTARRARAVAHAAAHAVHAAARGLHAAAEGRVLGGRRVRAARGRPRPPCASARLERVTARRLRPAPQDAALRACKQLGADPEALLAAAGIDPPRAEELSVADFARLGYVWTAGLVALRTESRPLAERSQARQQALRTKSGESRLALAAHAFGGEDGAQRGEAAVEVVR